MKRALLLGLVLLAWVAPAEAQYLKRAIGTISVAGTDCSNANACVVLGDTTRTANGTIAVGTGWTGTVQFEGTLDSESLAVGSRTWFALSVNANGSTSFVTSATANGQWTIPMALTGLRVRASTLSSGSVPVTLLTTSASRSGGAGGGGTGAPTTSVYWIGASDASLSGAQNLGLLGTGLVINTAGVPSAYAGASCTNQFPRSLSASGAPTCASVANADLAGSIVTSKLNSLSGNGSTVATTTGALTSGNCVKIDASGNLVDNGAACAASGAGGSNTQVLFNSSGSQAGDATFTFDSTNKTVSLPGVAVTVATKSADYTLTRADYMVCFDTTGAARTATLPTSVTKTGLTFAIKNCTGTNNVTIARQSIDTIDGLTSQTLRPGESVVVIADGVTTWDIF